VKECVNDIVVLFSWGAGLGEDYDLVFKGIGVLMSRNRILTMRYREEFLLAIDQTGGALKCLLTVSLTSCGSLSKVLSFLGPAVPCTGQACYPVGQGILSQPHPHVSVLFAEPADGGLCAIRQGTGCFPRASWGHPCASSVSTWACVVLGFLAAVCLGRAGRLPAPKARSHRGRAPCHLRESALLLRSGHTHLEPCAGGAALCCQHGLDLERNSGTLSYRASPPRSLCWLRDSK